MYLSKPLLEHVLFPPAKQHAMVLTKAAHEFNINTENRLGCWLGQMHIESKGFTKVRENLNYSVEGLLKTFGRHRISLEDAKRYGRIPGRQIADQKAIAARIYGGEWGRRELGNLYADDAWRFIGRGFKQVTGRYNYAVMSTHMFGDDRLLYHPELLEQPEYAAMSAGEFWNWKELNRLADNRKHAEITKIITGGLGESVDESGRHRQSEAYILRIANGPRKPDFSNVISGSSTKPRAG